MNYSAIILAAGSGQRCQLGYNKLLYQLDDQTVIEKTVAAFLNERECTQIVLVTSIEDLSAMKELFQDQVDYVIGGSTRQESSYNGVKMAKEKNVMIHDGARPYVSHEEIMACNAALIEVEACCLMISVSDTIKLIQGDFVESTLNRSQLMAALTPQCFRKELIQTCLEKAIRDKVVCSDDASVVEKCSNTKVKVVLGKRSNIKITTREDL